MATMRKNPAPAEFREVSTDDYADILTLYRELTGDIAVLDGPAGHDRFLQILTHPGTQIFGAEIDGQIVSAATLHILPNLTFSGRPYGLIENVVTLRALQGRGLARGVMRNLIDTAWQADAYKIMLLTGKTHGARGFYQKLGFLGDQKHGMMLRRAPMRNPDPI